jgi:hypothetical protein
VVARLTDAKPITEQSLRVPIARCLGPAPTPGQRWRFKRDLAIYLAWRGGMSQRMLADVFDLPRSRVQEIVLKVGQIAATIAADGA